MIWHSLLLTLTLTAAEAGGNLSPEDKADLQKLFPEGTTTSEKLDRWVMVTGDFDKCEGRQFQPTDPAAWRITATERGKVFEQFAQSKYQPPHRSPFNIAWLKDVVVEDFVFTAHVKSTTRDYGHRDMCLFFGCQDAAHFYYVHLGKKADPNSNQIMIVNNAARVKITKKESPSTDWDDQWHVVKIVRRTSDGSIEVYFDDLKTPVLTAQDKTFLWGQVGIGSFDDTGLWDDVKLQGIRRTGR